MTMPTRDFYQLQQRNTAVRNAFYRYLQEGMPIMLAYAHVAEDYYLSEEYIRQIVAKRTKKNTIGE